MPRSRSLPQLALLPLLILSSLSIVSLSIVNGSLSIFNFSPALAQSSIPNRKLEADQLIQQGVQQLQSNQNQAASQTFEQALMLYRQIQHQPGVSAALIGLGEASLRLGNSVKALELSQQAIAIAKELNNPELEKLARQVLDAAKIADNPQKREADRLLQEGAQQIQNNQLQPAIQSLEQALTLYRQLKHRPSEGAALIGLAETNLRLGNSPKALELSQQAIAIAKEFNNPEMEKLARQVLEIAQKVTTSSTQSPPQQTEADRLLQQGIQQYQTSQFQVALQSWQQALVLYRQVNNRQGEGWALGNLGLAYQSLGDYAKAIDYEQQWLVIAREIKDRQSEGKALGNLGIAYQSLGDYAKAIEYQQQWLVIAREIKDRQSQGAALGNLGLNYQSLGDYAKAIEYGQQLLLIAREIKDRQSEARSLGDLGNSYLLLGAYAKAIDYAQQSLAIVREIKDRQSEGMALGNLGLAYDYLGDYAKAIEYQQQSLVIAREIKDRHGEGRALNNLGLSLEKSGNLMAAQQNLMAAIQVWESLRGGLGQNDANKVSIFEQQARTYHSLQRVLIAQNQPNAALEIAERGRARAFVELLSTRLSGRGAVTSPPQSTVTPPISPLSIAQIQQIAQAQNATLVQYTIIYDDFKINGKQETKESQLYIWFIAPNGTVTFRTADLKPLWQQQQTNLAQLVVQSRETIGARGRSEIVVTLSPERLKAQQEQQTRNLKQLHQLLIAPIADLLPQDSQQRVIFVPQRELFLVPFPALINADGKPLIEQHTILTAPSIQVLALTRQQRKTAGSRGVGKPLIVGNPTMPKVVTQDRDQPMQLSNLPGAKQEALAIAKLFNTQAITGAQATETAIAQQMPNARIIHLATHGLLDDFTGLGVPGAISLAPSGTGQLNDGLLTSDEILDMKLNAELVVLSACDTGRGRITGDGVIGLSRSLITAGVPSIIVSLWKVPDEQTALLMTEFYKNLGTTKDKAQALRQAMLTTKQKYPDPLNWAAFTLIGEAE